MTPLPLVTATSRRHARLCSAPFLSRRFVVCKYGGCMYFPQRRCYP